MTKEMVVHCVDGDCILRGYFYHVKDFMGEPKPLIAIELEDKYEEVDIQTVSFGEFVGQYGAFFPDVNNHPDFTRFIEEFHIAFPIGASKTSGFVTYPAYRLSPYAMEALFSTEDIWKYNLAYDFDGSLNDLYEENLKVLLENAEIEGNPITVEDASVEVIHDLVHNSLNEEKASFDEFLEHWKADHDNDLNLD